MFGVELLPELQLLRRPVSQQGSVGKKEENTMKLVLVRPFYPSAQKAEPSVSSVPGI